MKAADLASRSFVIMTLTLAMAGCGNGDLDGDDSSSSGGSTNATAQGLWQGTDSASGLALTGIIDSAGVADFIRADGTQYSGTVEISGSALVIALNVDTQFGSQFADGSTYGVGTLNATVATGSTISGSLSFTTSDNNALSSTWSLTYGSLYQNASSLAAISGNYTDSSSGDPLDGATVSISGTGAMTAQSASTGCVMNGQVTIPDTSYDAYAITYTLENCAGADAVLNGLSFTGLALLNSSASPAQALIGVRGQNASGNNYGIASELSLT